MGKKRPTEERVRRLVARELVHVSVVHIYSSNHELWRLASNQDGQYGLTDKERAFLRNRQKNIDKELELLRRFRSHLEKSL